MKKFIILIILTACFSMQAVKAQEDVVLTLSDFEITPGGNAILTIESDIALSDYCSFQFDLLLPEGIVMPYNMNPDEEEKQFGYFDSEEEEWIPAIESGITKSSHTLACSAIEGGYRFVCYHPKFTVFKSGSKNVLTLQLQANDDVINGVYHAALGGTMFIANNEKHIVPIYESGTIVVKGSNKSATYEFTMSEDGLGTLILPFDTAIPDGITAYNCIDIEGENIILNESSTIYANTPYLLKGTPGNYNFTGVPFADKEEYSSGCMTGVHVATKINSGYVLQNIDGLLAFYRVNEDFPITIPAGHCYINTNGDTPYINIDKITGIDGVAYNGSNEEIYNIKGIKVESTENNHIYIINNKKKYIK